jgi:polyhydroxybutyrate depolymerase
MSNGGLMSYRLACEAGDIFKSIASVAGTDNTVTCAPSRPISVLHIHAQDDDMVLFGGGAGRDRAAVTDFVSVPQSITKWVHLNSCNTIPTRVWESQGAYCDLYAPCSDGVEVKLCVTPTGGHSWPGGTKVRGGEAGSTAMSATDVIAEFFASRP